MQEPFYTHKRKTIFNKDYTVCGIVVDYMTHQELFIGVAICSPEDSFVKAEGRQIAYEKAQVNPFTKLVINEKTPLHTFLDFVDTFMPIDALYERMYIDLIVK